MRNVGTEIQLYEQIARYLALRHPELNGMWHFDLSGVNNPSPASRALYSRLNRRAWPDLFIAVPSWRTKTIDTYYGLFLELKRDGERLKKKDGTWASEHIAEQYEMLVDLAGQGYIAMFAVGFDETMELIESYLQGTKLQTSSEPDDGSAF